MPEAVEEIGEDHVVALAGDAAGHVVELTADGGGVQVEEHHGQGSVTVGVHDEGVHRALRRIDVDSAFVHFGSPTANGSGAR